MERIRKQNVNLCWFFPLISLPPPWSFISIVLILQSHLTPDTLLHLYRPACIRFADQSTAENKRNTPPPQKGTQSQHKLQRFTVQTAHNSKVFTKYLQLRGFQLKKNPQKHCGCSFEKPIHPQLILLQTCYSHWRHPGGRGLALGPQRRWGAGWWWWQAHGRRAAGAWWWQWLASQRLPSTAAPTGGDLASLHWGRYGHKQGNEKCVHVHSSSSWMANAVLFWIRYNMLGPCIFF